MIDQPQFHVEEVVIPDPAIWPTDWTQMITRYALIDQKGTVWLGGRQFGSVRTMKRADRTSYDCRDLFRKSVADAWLDQIRWPIDRDSKDLVWECMSFTWEDVPHLIRECGSIAPVIEAFFEMSGSSVIRDYQQAGWIDGALSAFGEALREPAKRWYDNPQPKHMPTMYLEQDDTNRRRKANFYANIKETAKLILERLGEEV